VLGAQVIKAPFPGVKEVLGGFWVLDVASPEAAIDWARQCPAEDNEVIEVRQVFEFQDFSAEVQQAASGFKECSKAMPDVERTQYPVGGSLLAMVSTGVRQLSNVQMPREQAPSHSASTA
jgi:hypothetical protein